MAIQPDPPIQLSPDMDEGHKVTFINQNFQSIANFLKSDSFKIIKVVTGTYTITSTDFSNLYANFSFPHNLGTVPVVIGSVSNSTNGSIKMLPALYYVAGSSYGFMNSTGTSTYSLIDISSIDSTNINISLKISDVGGLSIFLNNAVLSFKLYCMQETAN